MALVTTIALPHSADSIIMAEVNIVSIRCEMSVDAIKIMIWRANALTSMLDHAKLYPLHSIHQCRIDPWQLPRSWHLRRERIQYLAAYRQ
jgi:hypothetical protein